MTPYRNQQTCLTADGARGLKEGCTRTDSREPMVVFDDKELCDWLMDCIEDGSENFLCAMAEAAVVANAEDYIVIRPALLALRRKYDAEHTE